MWKTVKKVGLSMVISQFFGGKIKIYFIKDLLKGH